MFARQIQPEPALHCAEKFNLRLLAENFLNKGEIGKIVLDVKDGALALSTVQLRHRFGVIGLRHFGRGRLSAGKIDPESTAASHLATRPDTAAHRVHDACRKSKAEASSLDRRLLRAQSVKGGK